MVHELGHLLLGVNSHSRSGVMKSLWNAKDLIGAEHGTLRFSGRQIRVIRTSIPDRQITVRDSANRRLNARRADAR